MSLSKQRKVALDRECLEFNVYATRILAAIHDKYPLAQVRVKSLMLFWVNGVFYKTVISHFLQKYHQK